MVKAERENLFEGLGYIKLKSLMNQNWKIIYINVNSFEKGGVFNE